MDEQGHIPVMAEQVVEMLTPSSGGASASEPGPVVLDGTIGRGGHAAVLIPRIRGGRYVGLDLDPQNVAYAQQRLAPIAADANVDLAIQHGSFQDAPAVLDELGVAGVDGLLADLGFASTQMDDPARGFAFAQDGPLDMRLDPTADLTACDLVNRLPERELADLIYQFGEERLSRRIAAKIVEQRGQSPMDSTRALAQLVRRAYGPQKARARKIHPATRTFMALRIAVNGELDALDRLLNDLPRLLRTRGRAAIISFHSLEDRRVKQAYLDMERRGLGRRLTRKPLIPNDMEQHSNPRSRSAKLRGFEFQRSEEVSADFADGAD